MVQCLEGETDRRHLRWVKTASPVTGERIRRSAPLFFRSRTTAKTAPVRFGGPHAHMLFDYDHGKQTKIVRSTDLFTDCGKELRDGFRPLRFNVGGEQRFL